MICTSVKRCRKHTCHEFLRDKNKCFRSIYLNVHALAWRQELTIHEEDLKFLQNSLNEFKNMEINPEFFNSSLASRFYGDRKCISVHSCRHICDSTLQFLLSTKLYVIHSYLPHLDVAFFSHTCGT
jgi:hypothetical protein